jgi:hypothetical protein
MSMRFRSDWIPPYVATLLFASSAMLLTLTRESNIASELMQIVVLISGVAFFSGLSLLLSFCREPRTMPFIKVAFDGRQLQERLGKVIDVEFTEVSLQEKMQQIEGYQDDDIVLALAKVRIDLERELRRLATETGAIREDQRFDMRRSIEALEKAESIPVVAIEAIRDILPICNRAIHGQSIDAADARNVIEVAREVMLILRRQRSKGK